jgi:hypothetical protein
MLVNCTSSGVLTRIANSATSYVSAISEQHEGEIRYPAAPGIKHLICVLPS